jgi:group I intron endonuclease
MKVEYLNAKIYKITNDFNSEVYVGSTCDTLVKRFSGHKRTMKEKPGRTLYKLMNEIGFERFRIELIENYSCEDKYQLRQREGYFIREMGTLNEQIAGRNEKDYYVDTKEKRLEYAKEYRQNEENKEHIKQSLASYREKNRDKLNDYLKSYRELNKEDIKEKSKEKIQDIN